jgi:hypothetical protein
MSGEAVKIWSIGNGHRMAIAEERIILNDDNIGLADIDRVPNPIIIAINIDRENTDSS